MARSFRIYCGKLDDAEDCHCGSSCGNEVALGGTAVFEYAEPGDWRRFAVRGPCTREAGVRYEHSEVVEGILLVNGHKLRLRRKEIANHPVEDAGGSRVIAALLRMPGLLG